MIPEPPSQGQPWTAPATKLPKFLVSATEILFEQGVADPRLRVPPGRGRRRHDQRGSRLRHARAGRYHR